MQTNNNHPLSVWINPKLLTDQEKEPQLQTKLRWIKTRHKQTRYPSRQMSRFPTEQLQRDFLIKNSKKHA